MLIERPIKNAPVRRHPPSPPSPTSPTNRSHAEGGIRCHATLWPLSFVVLLWGVLGSGCERPPSGERRFQPPLHESAIQRSYSDPHKPILNSAWGPGSGFAVRQSEVNGSRYLLRGGPRKFRTQDVAGAGELDDDVYEVDVLTGDLRLASQAEWDSAAGPLHHNRDVIVEPGWVDSQRENGWIHFSGTHPWRVTGYGGGRVMQFGVGLGGTVRAIATYADTHPPGKPSGFDASRGAIGAFTLSDPRTHDSGRIYIQFVRNDDWAPVGPLIRCQAVSILWLQGAWGAIMTPDERFVLVVGDQLDYPKRTLTTTVSVIAMPTADEVARSAPAPARSTQAGSRTPAGFAKP